ncbi:MAG TPA: IS110 family transposase [Erysipelotrichaceae bacterium]|nr:IS110 family transposase [Erysipelotrichia bacterium]HPX32481.1 IS110 family transposase [Erysipelotrichaceae bacterium]HQA85178.1 IS110 family transposase [Erysipelotrichaceae bacterium]
MTYFVGINIAKFKHVASILDSSTGELIVNSLHFDNNLKGFNLLLSNLSMSNKEDVVISFESTAHYHLALFNFLNENDYRCVLVNPLQISRFRKISLRDTKNDNVDSRTIACFLLLEHQNILEEEFYNNELKELCSQRFFLIQHSSKLKIKLVSYLDRVFPELESTIPKGTLHTMGLRAILKKYPTAKQISNVRVDHLVNIAKKASKGRYKESMVIKIKEAAKSSIGFYSSGLALKIRQSIESLESIERQIDEVESFINSHHTVINSPLHKIKGINSIEIA